MADGRLSGRLTVVTDPDDPRIAGFRDIRERDLRRREGRFIAEGTVVLRVLADVHGGSAGFTAESILVLENRVAGIADILERFSADVPIFVVSRPVIDALAGFAMHRGVLALARHSAERGLDALLGGLPDDALVVAGHGISNHDNLGAIFRNGAVFGADAALFDETSCDPLYRKAIRVSVGGVLKLPFVRAGAIGEIVAALQAHGFDLLGLSPRGVEALEAIVPRRRTALLVGTEGEGLPEALTASIRTARIAQAPGMDSLNVATAAGIALHRIALKMGRIS